MNDALLAAFNNQIAKEFSSAYLYLGMSAWCEEKGLPGFAHWMRMQYEEELLHAQKMFTFVYDRDGSVTLQTIAAPECTWSTALDIVLATLEHERAISASINQLMTLSLADHDHASAGFLHWFVSEQVEEEATVRDIRDRLKIAGDSGQALLMLDAELGKRAKPILSPSN